MLATECPSCGRPAPIHLVATSIVCPACGERSAVPADASERLLAAAQVLRGVQVHQRQLGRRSRRLLLSAGYRAQFFAAAVAIVLIPFGGCALLGLSFVYGDRSTDPTAVLLWAAPLALIGLIGGAGLRAVGVRARRLRERCAALAPAGDGEPAGCYVCGGPVRLEGDEPVARCEHCRADNVVTPRDMKRARETSPLAVGDFEQSLRSSSIAADVGMMQLLRTLIAFAAAAALSGTIGCLVSSFILSAA